MKLISEIYYNIGCLLSEVKNSKDYKHYASHIHNWNDYLKEINLSYKEAQDMIDVYETFPDRECKSFERMKDIAKLKRFGFIDDKKKEELYENSLCLPIKDWKDEVQKAEGKSGYLTCDHSEFDNYIRCTKCGKWLKQ